MATSGPKTTRRQFVSRTALLSGGIGLGLNSTDTHAVAESETDNPFSSYQKLRREALWGLLGDLPWQHEPAPPKVVRFAVPRIEPENVGEQPPRSRRRCEEAAWRRITDRLDTDQR